MSTIESNELYSVLRDVANQSLTVGDAMEKIQGINKSDMKEDVTADIPPADLAAQIAAEGYSEPEEIPTDLDEIEIAEDEPLEVVTEEDTKPAPKRRK